MNLLEAATGAGSWHSLPPGLWKITADIATSNAAVVTIDERDNASGQARPVKDPAGVAYSISQPGGSFLYTSSWTQVRATSTGGTAVTVRALPVSNSTD